MEKKKLFMRALGRITIEPGEVLLLDESEAQKPWCANAVARGDFVQVGHLEGVTAYLRGDLPPGVGLAEPMTWEEWESLGIEREPTLPEDDDT